MCYQSHNEKKKKKKKKKINFKNLTLRETTYALGTESGHVYRAALTTKICKPYVPITKFFSRLMRHKQNFKIT